MQKYYFWKNNELYLNIYLKPRSKKNMIVGLHNNRLKIFLTSPPVNNLANEYLVEFLAEYFRVPKKQITIVKGKVSTNKVICIKNAVDTEQVLATIDQLR
jgi:uncharacterized protein (TIGR00251 family)